MSSIIYDENLNPFIYDENTKTYVPADSDDKDMTLGDYIEDETEMGRDPSDLTD